MLLASILLANLSLWGQTADWNSHENKNYSIEYPKDWELDESGQMGTSFILFSSLSSQRDLFKENVNLLVQDLTGYNLDLEKFVEVSEDQIEKMLSNGKIIESERVPMETLSYHKVIYSGKQGEFDLKFEQYYWVVEDRAYVLTFTCEEDQFDTYKPIGEKILNTFKLN